LHHRLQSCGGASQWEGSWKKRNMGRRNKMNDEERRQWVLNDEGVYRWYIRSRMGLYRFIRENREELTEIIEKAINKEPEESRW